MNAAHPGTFWSLSFTFNDWELAGKAYEQSRDLIFGLDMDASAYRILLNGRAYVVNVGAGVPEQALVGKLKVICQKGEESPLADEVALTLAVRHEQFRATNGTRYERRG